MKNFADVATLLVDANKGIYIAQIVCQKYEYECFEGLHFEDYSILQYGPEHDEYANTFEALENSSISIENVWYAFYCSNGDLFIYPETEHENIDWESIQN